MANFDTAHGKATPDLSSKAPTIDVKQAAVKNVSDTPAAFRTPPAQFSGSSADFSSSFPCKGAGSKK